MVLTSTKGGKNADRMANSVDPDQTEERRGEYGIALHCKHCSDDLLSVIIIPLA